VQQRGSQLWLLETWVPVTIAFRMGEIGKRHLGPIDLEREFSGVKATHEALGWKGHAVLVSARRASVRSSPVALSET
jgi:hypothetical protein